MGRSVFGSKKSDRNFGKGCNSIHLPPGESCVCADTCFVKKKHTVLFSCLSMACFMRFGNHYFASYRFKENFSAHFDLKSFDSFGPFK